MPEPLAFALLTPATAAAALTAARFGKGIAETRPGRILVAADDGSGARVLARGWSSYMSPDGARVAVLTDGALELYATTGGPALWATHDLACGPVEWAPDASKLACVTAGESLVLLDAATGAIDTLASGSYLGMSFSPDSNRLAYVDVLDASGRGTLNVLDLSTRAITRLRGSAILPVWGPETIAFGLASGGRNPRFDVAVVRPDGTGFRRLTRYRADSSHRGLVPRAWSADGRRLLAGVRGDDFDELRGLCSRRRPRRSAAAQPRRLAGRPDPRRPLRDRPDGQRRHNRPLWLHRRAPAVARRQTARAAPARGQPELERVMRTPLLLTLTIAAFGLAAPSASAVGGPCSKSTANRVARALDYGDPTNAGGRVGEVLCGAFLGPGSRAMVITEAIPSCGANVGWAVLRKRAGHWRMVKRVRHGAFLKAEGSDIREEIGIVRGLDPHCFPSAYKSRLWRWNGRRLVAGAWVVRPSGSNFLSPDRQMWCYMSSESAACTTRDNQHRAVLAPDGRLTLCSKDCIQNWDTQAPVLLAGQTVELGGFRCTSDARGITCTVAATGKGFTINATGVTAGCR